MEIPFEELQTTIRTINEIVLTLRRHLTPVYSPDYSVWVSKKVMNFEIPLSFTDTPLEVRCYDYKTREQVFIFKYKSNIKAYTIVDIRNEEHLKDFPLRLVKWFSKEGISII